MAGNIYEIISLDLPREVSVEQCPGCANDIATVGGFFCASLLFAITKGLREGDKVIPIGRPNSNCQNLKLATVD